MLIDLAQVLAGLAVLLVAGDLLVRGAVNLALRLGIPALMVGMTVVAFGTSAPELVVSVQAVWIGAGGLALGNVVGSNIANILLVLGLPALIAPLAVDRALRRDFTIMMAATALFMVLAAGGVFHTWQALVLLAGLGLMLGDNLRRARAIRAENHAAAADASGDDLEGADPALPGWKLALFLGLGIIGLPIGAQLLVAGAVDIAAALGVSDALIGLTLVAVGTSLPELATTLLAAWRREAGVAMGNVIGSNIFNLLCIIGVAGLVGPIPVPETMLRLDLWVMAASSLLLLPFILRGSPITRPVGLALSLAYAGYITLLVVRGG
ncbi:MAG: calcium/sodium antiporter [Rhodobacteraceae bacterium]|nr:calcium/sodium antiporter [Paracoccaceae bacterium]